MNRGVNTPKSTPTSPRLALGHRPAWGVFIGITFLALAGDLWLKYWAFANVAQQPVVITEQTLSDPSGFWRDHAHAPIELVPKVLSLHLMTNLGAVFGLGQGGRWFFIVVSVLAVLAIPIFFSRTGSRQWLIHAALALIMAGAMGNLYDRLVYGCVRDMLWLFPELGLWPWIFNLADAALMIGVGLVMIITWRSGSTDGQASKAQVTSTSKPSQPAPKP